MATSAAMIQRVSAHPRDADHRDKTDARAKSAPAIVRAALIVKDAVLKFIADTCYRGAASLAYYALFSIFPLLLLSVSFAGYLLGNDDAHREHILGLVTHATSPASQQLLDDTLKSMQQHTTARGIGAIVGLITLLYGASSVFSELETSLDTIWDVKSDPHESTWKTVISALKSKLFAFAVVIGTSVLLLLSLAATTTLGALETRVADVAGGNATSYFMWHAIDTALSLALETALFATLFRIIPHAAARWRDTFRGGAVAAILMWGLKVAYAFYLSHLSGYAAYGVVGAVLGLLTWVYLAGCVFFFGAEIARACEKSASAESPHSGRV